MQGPVAVRLDIIILAVEDVERSVAFWQQAFGFVISVKVPVYVELEIPGGPRLGIYERSGFGKNIGQSPATPMPDRPQPTELYFRCEDLDEAIARLERAGAPVLSSRRPRDWGDEAAYFSDPDGNVVVVAQPLS